ncbi:Uncharacterised protein [Mycobacteroides abscessus subsp. abscessus]|nr:Uncharacterised protein [Mycobacteroides abscessus subsp. abscessus]SIM33652.1 Uncharacterised protein [Mycobacteroides abscessus subsp. abscessus]SLF10589.1 Uncharacterised protein [Mycobacteroides abscessus subsp. abscessus]
MHDPKLGLAAKVENSGIGYSLDVWHRYHAILVGVVCGGGKLREQQGVCAYLREAEIFLQAMAP